MKKALLLIAAMIILVGCSSNDNPCRIRAVVPDGYPHTIDHFGTLQFNDCEYNYGKMRELRDAMRNTAFEVTACLDSVYGYEFATQSPQGSPTPYFSKIVVVPDPLNPPHTNIKFSPSVNIVTYHPTLMDDGVWDMKDWAGELHTMYRGYMLGSFSRSVVYDDDLPFEKAAKLAHNTCIVRWLE